ncbi:MAG: SEC-C metal-binding domain-containing protein [Acidimicrobiales bacterium]
MSTLRPAGSGREARALAFVRTIASPRSALVLTSDAVLPGDWPIGEATPEANLGHALGWTAEVRRHDLVLLNPLGEGIVKAALPDLSVEWLSNVRHDGSCAIYLAPSDHDAEFAELAISAAAAAGELRAATVRTAVADDYGKTDPVGRNQPCPCGSGKKYKHCHG